LPERIWAYTINVLGSLAGIGAFAAASSFETPPVVWFALGGALVFVLLHRRTIIQLFTLVLLILTLGLSTYVDQWTKITIWSPYSKVQYDPRRQMIDVNNIGHQGMLRIVEAGPAYSLPYLLNAGAGGDKFKDVLIIGAGSGNDVQAALMFGDSSALHVDAVEI